MELASAWEREWPQRRLVLSSQHIVAGVKYAGTVNLGKIANAACPQVCCMGNAFGCLLNSAWYDLSRLDELIFLCRMLA